MRAREIIKGMPTQFRGMTSNPLNTGHYIPLLGVWTKAEGYVKKQSLVYKNESLACPVIAVVNDRVGKEDVILTITAKTSVYASTEEKTQGDYTIKRKKYTPTETTIQTTLTIPRFTRQWATFLLTGLGKNVYEISTITDSVNYDTSKIEFYALASSGSRIIYWLGLHQLAETLRDILQGPWISPTRCFRCKATGIEPGTTEPCKQCNGYKYSGYNATRSIQRAKGFDVGLARQVLDWDNMTDADHKIVKEFINKSWTQKWWVTPTPTQIKRLFAHFFQLHEDDIKIEERFHLQEPVWRLLLPTKASGASPFGTAIYENYEDLLKYIARSVTPAGVSVFIGFYNTGWFGEFDFSTGKPSWINFKSGAFETRYKLLGRARWTFWNGWTEGVDHFERATGSVGGIWTVDGDVTIVNVNDINRHMAKFVDNCYIEHDGDISGVPTGKFEMWVHPQDTEMRFGLADGSGLAMYLKYVNTGQEGFYDHNNNLLRAGLPHCDYHLRVDFVVDAQGPGHTGQYGYIEQVQINQKVVNTGYNFLRTLGVSPTMRIQNIGSGTGFMDAYGNSWNASGYQIGDNRQRLHPKGFGLFNHTDGIFYATYNFKDVPVGTKETDIDFVDFVNLYEGGVEIVSDWQGHTKVLRLQDDATGGEDPHFHHNITQSTSGTHEFWIGTNNVTAYWEFYTFEGGIGYINRLRISAGNMSYYDGSAWNVLIAVSNNILYHIKLVWRADNTQDIYINDILEADNVSTDDNMVSGVNRIFFKCFGDSTDYLYIDAYGETEDVDYTVGDNLIECLYHNNIRQDKFWKEP